jgi:hypothetical protein
VTAKLTGEHAPDAARALLSYQLRRITTQKEVSHETAGKAIGLTRVGFTAIVQGRNLPSDEALTILAELTDHEQLLPHLLELVAIARERRRVEIVKTKEDFYLLLGLEAYARRLQIFESSLVTALLQAEDYAWHMFNGDAFSLPPDHPAIGDENLAIWRDRQAVLTGEPPTELEFIVEEQVLHRPVGGRKVMRAQLDHLVAMSERPGITIRVLPANVAVHSAMGRSFQLFDMEDHRVGYEETLAKAHYPTDLSSYDRALHDLGTRALDQEESRARILMIKGAT